MRRVLIACSVLSSVVCGPMQPTSLKLDLQSGQYMLIVTAAGTCTLSKFMPSIGTLLTLSHEGVEWVARSRSNDDGNVVFRFREVADARVAGVAVDGTLTGTGKDFRPFAPPGSRVSLSGESSGVAAVSAQFTPSLPDWIAGRANGQLTFDDGTGGPLSCPDAEVALRLPAPCELNGNASCR